MQNISEVPNLETMPKDHSYIPSLAWRLKQFAQKVHKYTGIQLHSSANEGAHEATRLAYHKREYGVFICLMKGSVDSMWLCFLSQPLNPFPKRCKTPNWPSHVKTKKKKGSQA